MNEPFALVDPRMTVAAARRRLERYSASNRVLLRRRDRLRDVWHAWTLADLSTRLAEAVEDGLLQDALDLAAEPPQPTLDLAAAEALEVEHFSGVLLLAGEAVGFAESPAAVASPSSRPSRDGQWKAAWERPGGYSYSVEAGEGDGGGCTASATDAEVFSGTGQGGDGGVFGADVVVFTPPETVAEAVAPVTFLAHPHLDAPRLLRPAEQFELVVGLASMASADVIGGPLQVPTEPGGETFSLGIQVVADGFTAPEGWRRTLAGRVDRFQEAEVTIPLVAPETLDEPFRLSSVIVHFTHGGAPIGTAWRNLLVRRPDAGELSPDERARLEQEAAPLPLGPSLPNAAPDLTVRIDKADGNFARGSFAWTFETPHPVEVPAGAVHVDLGEDVRTFAKVVIDEIDQNRGTALLNGVLENLGDYIAERVPEELWDLLGRVREEIRKSQDREVTLLLLSSESYVPWELARMPRPLEPSRPPFLGAQVAMGRWILGRTGPPLPPLEKIDVRSMAVVVGDYGHVERWRELPFAIEEGEALVRSYRALSLPARADELDALFEARLARDEFPRGAEAVHFACHGKGNPTQLQSASIILEPDGKALSYFAVRATALGRDFGPFVFMNACQVGTAGDVLGQYAGFAGTFLKAGARGFLAPLWSVDDKVANQLALELYDKAFAGQPVGEILRANRCRADLAPGAITESTYLSYIFYGHPRLMLADAGVKRNGTDV